MFFISYMKIMESFINLNIFLKNRIQYFHFPYASSRGAYKTWQKYLYRLSVSTLCTLSLFSVSRFNCLLPCFLSLCPPATHARLLSLFVHGWENRSLGVSFFSLHLLFDGAALCWQPRTPDTSLIASLACSWLLVEGDGICFSFSLQ